MNRARIYRETMFEKGKLRISFGIDSVMFFAKFAHRSCLPNSTSPFHSEEESHAPRLFIETDNDSVNSKNTVRTNKEIE